MLIGWPGGDAECEGGGVKRGGVKRRRGWKRRGGGIDVCMWVGKGRGKVY